MSRKRVTFYLSLFKIKTYDRTKNLKYDIMQKYITGYIAI